MPFVCPEHHKQCPTPSAFQSLAPASKLGASRQSRLSVEERPVFQDSHGLHPATCEVIWLRGYSQPASYRLRLLLDATRADTLRGLLSRSATDGGQQLPDFLRAAPGWILSPLFSPRRSPSARDCRTGWQGACATCAASCTVSCAAR